MKKSIMFLSLFWVQAALGMGFDAIKERGYLKVAVFEDKAPFGYRAANGSYEGFDVEIAREIAKDLFGDAQKIKFVSVEAGRRVESLMSGKADLVLANFTQTPRRAKAVDFAKPYMYDA